MVMNSPLAIASLAASRCRARAKLAGDCGDVMFHTMLADFSREGRDSQGLEFSKEPLVNIPHGEDVSEGERCGPPSCAGVCGKRNHVDQTAVCICPPTAYGTLEICAQYWHQDN